MSRAYTYQQTPEMVDMINYKINLCGLISFNANQAKEADSYGVKCFTRLPTSRASYINHLGNGPPQETSLIAAGKHIMTMTMIAATNISKVICGNNMREMMIVHTNSLLVSHGAQLPTLIPPIQIWWTY